MEDFLYIPCIKFLFLLSLFRKIDEIFKKVVNHSEKLFYQFLEFQLTFKKKKVVRKFSYKKKKLWSGCNFLLQCRKDSPKRGHA